MAEGDTFEPWIHDDTDYTVNCTEMHAQMGKGSPRQARCNQIENIIAVYQNRRILVFPAESNSLHGSVLNMGGMHLIGNPC